ncbi:uncharacterized protein CTRU02_204941 [Colletotrichum truncatum]|uniref:Uncharacterized protein n=1 Tax=Colletotrichum truncatum TaxID=5467 RepID=A0ACC3Z2M4_COLTU|nr:uncharacterized protein CTRU02_13999 [Colletotrichum truncatum]KAF6782680.1 hypothetical protein CTRU02_13999 [Colletotrichum truncatum]
MDDHRDRTHICSFCNRGFRKPEHLQRHRRIHTKEKPYSCECGSSFARKDMLQRHRRIYHNPDSVSTNNNVQRSSRAGIQPMDPLSDTASQTRSQTVSIRSHTRPEEYEAPLETPNDAQESIISLGEAVPLPPEYHSLSEHPI